MKELVIRKAERKDIPVILEMIKELAVFEKLIDQVEADEQILEENLFRNKFAEVLIAEYDHQAVGQALFFHNFSTFVGKPGIYLEDIYVRPPFRSRGIGKAILQKIIDMAEERNCGRIEWAVLDWNDSAINFYNKLGAIQMNEWRIFRLTADKIKSLAGQK